MHSQIEHVCGYGEIYSPVGLMRMLKKVNRRKPLKIIQMRPPYLKDFHSIAQPGQYQRVYLLPKQRVFCLNKTSPKS